MSLPERSMTVLVAALGGEGGGVMADWLMHAATLCPSFYRAEVIQNPTLWDRTMHGLRRSLLRV